jgi:pentatricopeptide repeat protein
MISIFTKNGFFDEALEHFHQMQLNDVNANVVTMVAVILVCAQS